MENGSKALIIAGAILLAILIIGLGVFIYNQASNTVGDTGMDKVAIRQFNGQFEQYLNKELGATSAKALIDTVKTVSDEKHKVNLLGITSKNDIKTGHKYQTEVEYTNGIISRITLSDTNGSTPDSNGGNGGIIVADDISQSAFNRQFYGFVGTTDQELKPSYTDLSISQVNELINIVDHSNDIYKGHYISLALPKNFDVVDAYECYNAISHFDELGYINAIDVVGID